MALIGSKPLTPHQIMASGRTIARQKTPWFTSALFGLVWQEKPGLGTMAVTKRGVGLWDPAWVATLTPEQTAAVQIHEVGHILRGHAHRCGSRDHHQFNIAGDAEINDDLLEMGFELPGSPVTPTALGMPDGKTAEEYYEGLQGKEPGEPGKPGKPGKPGDKGEGPDGNEPKDDNGDDEGEGAGEGEGEGGSGEGEGGSGDGEPGGSKGGGKGGSALPPPPKPGVGSGHCGGAAGNPVEGEDEAEEEAGGGRSEVDVERIKRQVAQAINDEASKGRGNIPGGWAAWAVAQLKPAKIRWQDELRHAVRQSVEQVAGKHTPTYGRVNRRQATHGWGVGAPILPGSFSPVPRISVGLDTSGSMGDSGIQRGLSEIAGILKAVKANVEFIACDCAVHTQVKVRDPKALLKLATGGGGTSFVPAFDAAVKSKHRPHVFIFLTDGQGDAPAVQPKSLHKVIWVLIGASKQKPDKVGGGTVDYGKFIEVNEEE